MTATKSLILMTLTWLIAGCSSPPPRIPAVPEVDIPRFMGRWYVIAHIPSYPERDAYDATETYELRADGRIQTTFRYRKGGFDEPLKTMTPIGTVREGSRGAVWGMQFVWPIQAEYVIVDLAPDYQRTIVGRSKRDYVWLMARTPTIPEDQYQAAMQRIAQLGYDVAKVRRVPQRPESRAEE
jgi:apolipoprotein D and lipocalin family protein